MKIIGFDMPTLRTAQETFGDGLELVHYFKDGEELPEIKLHTESYRVPIATVRADRQGSHEELWISFMEDLIKFIDESMDMENPEDSLNLKNADLYSAVIVELNQAGIMKPITTQGEG